MPSSISGRRKGSRTARANKKPSNSSYAPSSSMPVPLPAIAESAQSAPAVAARILSARSGVSSKQKTEPTRTPTGNEMAIVQKGKNPPNVFDFLQEDDSSPTSSDSDSDHEGLQALADSQPRRGSRNGHSSYLVSPESSFRASSPEQAFSVTSRDSTGTDVDATTSPDGSPATAYLRLANKHNLQKIAQTRSRLNSANQVQTSPTGDEEPDYSAPEDYYLTERRHYHRHQHPQPSHNGERKHRKDRHKSQRQFSSSSQEEEGERGAGTLVTTTETRKNNKLAKTERNNITESRPSSGYALLASKLDSSAASSSFSSKTGSTSRLVPVYRRFENVNHRILLYLQDEISQMEEELQILDEYEAKHRTAIAEKEETERLEPASHRMDVEARGYSAFHARRLELVDRLAYKVNQYNDALCSYTRLRQIPKASSKDIQTYQAWMKEHTPIAKTETRFLEHELDLVSLNTTSNNEATTAKDNNNNGILYFIIGVMSAALLLPLLAY
ncbi:hypothetical protein UA08_01511 [Talaromyces atroroseus]|uniref:DUF6594 domain-containing protein n=1 Tax=Talaromyces atroroseus TaxID=1441469 RepID=A0A1Q5QC39_TALAT|nr:hypothetical protein UA08_01511 [Talaromyces atroroseus]OKL63388.1 hypothetical protein UA08_01511 [Talaromyces atroroseus]